MTILNGVDGCCSSEFWKIYKNKISLMLFSMIHYQDDIQKNHWLCIEQHPVVKKDSFVFLMEYDYLDFMLFINIISIQLNLSVLSLSNWKIFKNLLLIKLKSWNYKLVRWLWISILKMYYSMFISLKNSKNFNDDDDDDDETDEAEEVSLIVIDFLYL